MEIEIGFALFLHKYLCRRHYNYNVDNTYRDLLVHVLQKINFFEKNVQIAQAFIEEGLRLDLITKKIVENINFKAYRLSFFEECRLKYLLDRSFKPEIRDVTVRSLKAILSNHNLASFAEENLEKILKVIEKLYSNDTCQLLTVFNLPLNKATSSIAIALVDRLAKPETPLERGGLDLVGVAGKLLKSNLYKNKSVRKLTERIVEIAKARIKRFSVQSHGWFV
jgi:hypothetical protein